MTALQVGQKIKIKSIRFGMLDGYVHTIDGKHAMIQLTNESMQYDPMIKDIMTMVSLALPLKGYHEVDGLGHVDIL